VVSRAGSAVCVAAIGWALIHAEKSHVADLILMTYTGVMSVGIAATSAPLGRNRLHEALDRLSLEHELHELKDKRIDLENTLPAPGPWGKRPLVAYVCLSASAGVTAVAVWHVNLMMSYNLIVEDGAWPITVFYYALAILILSLWVRTVIAVTTAVTSWTFSRSKIAQRFAALTLACLPVGYLVITIYNLTLVSGPVHSQIAAVLIVSILFFVPTIMVILARLPGPVGRRGPGLVALRNICRKWEQEERGVQKQITRKFSR
jgi:hypothetical protein